MSAILPVMELDADQAFKDTLRACDCAVCRAIRAQLQSGVNHMLLNVSDSGTPTVQTVGRKRPLASETGSGIQSKSTS